MSAYHHQSQCYQQYAGQESKLMVRDACRAQRLTNINRLTNQEFKGGDNSKQWYSVTYSATYSKSSTRRGHTPASITAWILSLIPSDRYESAQHASVRTSSSFVRISWARAGRAGFTCPRGYTKTGTGYLMGLSVKRYQYKLKCNWKSNLVKMRLWFSPTEVW